MGVLESMSATAKGLKGAKSSGGFFYFVSDTKGQNAALMVVDKGKDPDGKKTFRMGRGLLKEFKKEFRKGLYSQGEIKVAGSSVTFAITKGSVKPAIMKKAFKASDLLHEGVGASNIGVLKGAKITMAGQEDPEQLSASDQEARQKELETWRRANAGLIFEMGAMSNAEIEELFDSEKAFAAYAKALPGSLDEDTTLQERQAETEALLDALAEGDKKLEGLKLSDPAAALVLENELNEKRLALAMNNPIDNDPFEDGVLSDTDKQSFSAAVRAGLELLFARVIDARQEIDNEQIRLDNLNSEDKEQALGELNVKRTNLTRELDAIQQQLEAARP